MNIRQYSIRCAAVAFFAALAFALAAPAMAQPHGSGQRYGGAAAVLAPLTAAETEALRFMREEEKLARDVYDALFEKWDLAAFRNIAASEQTNFDAIGRLLARYGVSDPAEGIAAGVYSNPELSALYNELMTKGAKSAQDALEVGVLIENTEIAGLENALEATAKRDLKRVYTNLMEASYNHLEAFETACQLLGVGI